MRVLWTVNLVPSTVAQKINTTATVLGGWVEAMAEQFSAQNDYTLGIACKCSASEYFEEEIDGISYYSLCYAEKQTESVLRQRCCEVIDSFQPDLIQIEGTEFLHAKVMLEIANRRGIRTVVSAQGILNGQYGYQCGQLPMDDMLLSTSVTKLVAALTLHFRKTLWYRPRMKTELEVLTQASNFLGRTTWDKAHLYKINPDAKYYSCSRVLRKPFYETKWDIAKMERHSIYIGNGYFALKGLHFMLMALPQLVREYPDIKLYIAGYEPIPKNDKRPFYKRGYAGYLKKLIDDLGIAEHIIFTGPLNAKQVAERLSTVNAYVLASTVENSPNTLGEAMLVGTPCVAAYVGGVSDMAVDGQDALFFRNDDPALLAWNVKRIFDDDQLAQGLSQNAQRHAAITHDAEKNYQDLIAAYQDICREEP